MLIINEEPLLKTSKMQEHKIILMRLFRGFILPSARLRLHFPQCLAASPLPIRRFPSPLNSELLCKSVLLKLTMAAAAGCGSAAAAAGGVAGGVAAARGRFPGRPWSSRSRLRSEKRWQLGRSGTEQDDTGGGGPRPGGCLALACGEDPSHLRLLGIEASYKSLGEAGYSSSGSEEVGSFLSWKCKRYWLCI